MFLWHYNDTGAPIKVGITVGNAGSSAYSLHNVNDSVQVLGMGSISDMGRCAATALVGGTMDSISPKDSSAPAGGMGVVREWNVPKQQIVGGIIEFTISNQTPGVALNYRVRTVAANNTSADLKLNQNAVVNYYAAPNGSIHPRGSWGFADIASSVSYSAGSGLKYYSINNGELDNIMTSDNSYKIAGVPTLQGPANSNKGHYGVKYNLSVNLTNTGPQKTVKIYLASRGAEYYAGAVQWSGDGVTYRVPNLAAPGDTPGTNQDAVEVATVTLPTGANITRTITVSTAGAASTPALIAFQTI